MTKQIRIEFYGQLGEGRLTCLGLATFPCLGKQGVPYPEDLTIYPGNPGVKQHPYYSQTYTCPPNNNSAGQCRMDYAILIWGQEGIYIHGWPNPPTYAGNGNQGTHGCIHLSMLDAQTVYSWVDTRTRILISRPW
jgi:lipoprotein-anchoring transpeptidase ErfK/SrfK